MRVLLADDDKISLRLLENLLKKSNYETVLANDGNEAWDLLQQPPTPDVALLDWLMPGIDGIEITRRLRAQSDAGFVYIILVTSNNRPEDITAGLDAGANDYITKPFNRDELKSRIAVGVRVVEYENSLQRMNKELRLFSSEMESLAQKRAQQLVQADRMVTLGTMAAGIAHEINNPLTVIHGNLGLIKGFWQSVGEKAYQMHLDSVDKSNAFFPEVKDVNDMIGTAEGSVRRIRSIIDGMRSFAHGQGGAIEEMFLVNCVTDAIQICLPKVKHMGGVQTNLKEIPFPVKGNPVQITQVLVNLISNAADALAGRMDPEIKVDLLPIEDHVELRVHDNGPGIAEEKFEDLWSPFFTTKPVGQGTGLGLAITRKIVEEHGGKIDLISTVGKGTSFILELPNARNYDQFIAEQRKKNNTNEPSTLID